MNYSKILFTYHKNSNNETIKQFEDLIKKNNLFRIDHVDTYYIALNRADDPFTPLLLPWNYESMINEHTNCQSNIIKLETKNDIRNETKEIIMKESDLYNDLKYKDLPAMAEILNKITEKLKQNNAEIKIDNVTDMKKFIEE